MLFLMFVFIYRELFFSLLTVICSLYAYQLMFLLPFFLKCAWSYMEVVQSSGTSSSTRCTTLWTWEVHCLLMSLSLPQSDALFGPTSLLSLCIKWTSPRGLSHKSVIPDCHLLEYTSTAQQEPCFQKEDYKSWQALDPGLGFVRIQIFHIHTEPTTTPCCPQWHMYSLVDVHKREYKTL